MEFNNDTSLEKLTFLPSDLNTLEIIAERLQGEVCKKDVRVVLEALKKRARWAMECKLLLNHSLNNNAKNKFSTHFQSLQLSSRNSYWYLVPTVTSD